MRTNRRRTRWLLAAALALAVVVVGVSTALVQAHSTDATASSCDLAGVENSVHAAPAFRSCGAF